MRRTFPFFAAATAEIALPKNVFKLHTARRTDLAELPTVSTLSAEDAKKVFYDMHYIRRMETLADLAFKKRMIRGFCHLYIGQEAIATGMELSLDFNDAIVTAYRCHGWHVTRGGNAFEVFTEMFGKGQGCSKGKGGSMHMYKTSTKYYGGNGIVGAQVPLGVGLGFKYLYDAQGKENPKNVSVALYGDGAANQGQVFEVYNMAALHKIPTLFVCENNQFGMGTAKNRASANYNFFERCDYIPGIKIDGMDALAVKEGTKWAKEYALQHGPVIIEMDSYRYMGHSMSDPGTSYRSRDDVKHVREERDCITKMKNYILQSNLVAEEELKSIERKAKKVVDEELVRAEKDVDPELKELWADIYSYAANEEPIKIKSPQGTVYYN
eukprot:PhM_4_TR2788/c0_g1_i1/m.78383/K00161/PDHA, pdhA; pyruvate dehydrogenase E1 component alpha subunit